MNRENIIRIRYLYMRILQVITVSNLGGAQTVVSSLSNELARAGNEVIIVSGEGDGKLFGLLDEGIKYEHVPSLVRRFSPFNDFKTIFTLRKLYLKYRPDIIHLHSSKSGFLGRIAFPPKKIVYTVHGFDSIRVAYRFFLPLERILQKRCNAIVGVSKYDRDNLISEKINNHVSYVYNGAPLPDKLTDKPFDEFSRFKHKIICIARLTPQKNHQLFLETAALLPDYAFLWIGNLDQPNFNYPENVFFLGNIMNACSYIRHADLFFLPSNYEGLPMSIIEALASGIPVVASNVGGISEMLDGVNGYAVANDAEEMASKIRQIVENEKGNTKIREACINKYLNNFTVNHMAKNYYEIYKGIVSDRKIGAVVNAEK